MRDVTIRLFFSQGPALGLRLLFCTIIAMSLMAYDHHTHKVSAVRQYSANLLNPVFATVDHTVGFFAQINRYFTRHSKLLEHIEQQQAQLQNLQTALQQYAALQAENGRLRELLKAGPKHQEQLIAASVIRVSSREFSNEIIINQGRNVGVYEGQTVLDSKGVLGQVIAVFNNTSRVLICDDPRSAIPVEDNRSGFRAIAVGKAQLSGQLMLQHVTSTADIKEGDLLVTSGLGGHFAQGYPVAQVTHVIRDVGEAFIQVMAQPVAALESVREVRLVTKQSPEEKHAS